MITPTLVLLGILSIGQSAVIYEKQAAKRAVDAYNYPLPVVTFSEASNPKQTIVETMKSVSPSQGRYLPPSPTATATTSTGSQSPISVSFNAYEAPVATKPSSTAEPVVISTPAAEATQKKRPSGGLGGFKYYGGSGANNNAVASVASTAVPSTPEPVRPESTPQAIPKQVQKSAGYDYPSPKSIRKPSKKQQKLADSKPEESAQGYNYDVGPEAIAASAVLAGSNTASGSSSGGMMGLSYMRQSSPFYSYHVMLD